MFLKTIIIVAPLLKRGLTWIKMLIRSDQYILILILQINQTS